MRCKTQRVQHQLGDGRRTPWAPGRPGGIEHSRLGVFVEIREVEIRGGRCKQRLVFGRKRHRDWPVCLVASADDVALN